MDFDNLNSKACRVFFFGSFLLLGVAVLERIANLFGYTFNRALHITPGQLLEWASVMVLFVLALLMRQVREELKRAKAR